MKSWIDNYYPLVIALAIGFLGFKLWDACFNRSVLSATSELVSVAAIIIGFLATALALIMSLGSNPLIVRLKEANVYNTITRYLWKSITHSFWVVSFAILLKIVNSLSWFTCNYQRWGVSLLFGLSALMLLSTYRSIHLLYKVLRGLDG